MVHDFLQTLFLLLQRRSYDMICTYISLVFSIGNVLYFVCDSVDILVLHANVDILKTPCTKFHHAGS